MFKSSEYLQPQNVIPSGTCNFSRIPTVMDVLEFEKSKADMYKNMTIKYLHDLFTFIKDNNHVFYWDGVANDEDEFRMAKKFFDDGTVPDSYKPKTVEKYDTFPQDSYFIQGKNRMLHDVDAENVLFSITDFDVTTDSWFCGKAYNTGIFGDEPIEYEGRIGKPLFVHTEHGNLKCKLINDTGVISYHSWYPMPFFNFRCTPTLEKTNFALLNKCSLFDLKHMHFINQTQNE